ncbi:MAG: hypothetical protein NVS3B2_00240 [Ramlibacter sp.]
MIAHASGPASLSQDDFVSPLSPSPSQVPLLAVGGWLREGFRAGFLLSPRVAPGQPSPVQLVFVFALLAVLQLALARLEVAGDAIFDLRGWLAPQWATGLLLLLAWWALPRIDRDAPGLAGVAAWMTLWMAGVFPPTLVSQLLSIAQSREWLPHLLSENIVAAWGLYLLLLAWMAAVGVRLAARFRVRPLRQAVLGVGLVVIIGFSGWQFPDRPWHVDYSRAPAPQRPRLELNQDSFETQQAVWRRSVDALAPQRVGVQDVYGLVFAPYAEEEVFLRESSMVVKVLEQRFDAAGRVLQLVNNPATNASLPWATPLNLGRAIEALAARMDREHDLLVVYLTSHGASNFHLAASHGPLQVDSVTPEQLRKLLDDAGIRNRVIAISACFSGGWVAPLAGPTTLVMTAADATHTSYGCGRRSELTFFGRAVFDEQLRKSHSFEDAFAAAVPVIRQREVEGHKPDGFSNPQISVGTQIRPFLQSLAQRLDGAH